ncbi:DUF2272 domain-containing protein [Roseomonas sp. NAR14]|uniref:DUF2272 domain-containing protein n=1 Tax=Roseomonas acroporae TaxID=2937791 RepID=A0A9X2BW31_9PROT|nr:DUF2272 domain-containing protein [Roseomonas acroporae]MCK8784619.1 DUF2272 domain-containing protein [Roseomonas acroporae]
MRRGLRLIPLLLLLAACAAPPGGTRVARLEEPPLPYPPSVRERMLRIARAEWEEWGRVTIDPRLPPRGADDGAFPAETAPDNFPRVLAYWRAVPDDEGAIARNRGLYAAALADPAGPRLLWRDPAWSAAFISFVLRNAGVDAREFPSSAAHSFYIDALIADAARYPAAAPFVPHAPGEYAPQVGDLVCGDRSPRPLRHWTERAAEAGRFRPMHCDIVVETPRTATGGEARAIGGNVRDTVALTRFPTDAAGLLLPRRAGAAPWLVVFENRLGRLPPWPAAPLAVPADPPSLPPTETGSPLS